MMATFSVARRLRHAQKAHGDLVVPFATDVDGSLWRFDYRDGKPEPAIVYLRCDMNYVCMPICDTFSEFFQVLTDGVPETAD